MVGKSTFDVPTLALAPVLQNGTCMIVCSGLHPKKYDCEKVVVLHDDENDETVYGRYMNGNNPRVDSYERRD
jgi:hypothetical protein